MASTYTLNNGIELIGTGEQSGTWGDTTNTNLSLVDTALDGQVTVTLPSAGTSGSPNTLPISDGAASDGRNRMVIFNDGGDLGATAYVQLTPNDAEKIIYVRNDLAGSRSIILFQGTYNASNDYELPAGTTAVIYFDGAGSGAVAANVFNNAYFDSLRLGSVSVTEIIDDDTMATAAATNIATSESIKAYVDAQVGANNELSEVLANGNTSGGTGLIMSSGDDLTLTGASYNVTWDSSDNLMRFASNASAIFGGSATDYLQIYSDGTNKYIQDTGSGSLFIRGSDLILEDAGGNDYIAMSDTGTGGTVELKHSATTRLTTSSTGVDITGTINIDSTSFDPASGWGASQNVSPAGLNFEDNGTTTGNLLGQTYKTDSVTWGTTRLSGFFGMEKTNGTGNGDFVWWLAPTNFAQNPSIKMRIASNNDITFYDSSGNASFVYDESAGSTFNENGDAKDFRVETDNTSHAFFVDSTTNSTSIGGNIPNSTYKLNVSSAQRIVGDTARLFVQATNNASGNHVSFIDVQTLSQRGSHIALTDSDGVEFGIKRDYASGSPITRAILYADDGTTQRRIMDWGKAGNYAVFNEEGNDMDFRIESDSRSNALVVDGGTGNLALNTTNSDFYTGFETTSIKLGPVASMWSLSNGSTDRRMTIDQNLYVNTDGTNRYLTTGAAARYQMNTGTHRFETAPSGTDDAAASVAVQMLILNSGDVRMGLDNSTAQELIFRTSSSAGRKVIKSLSRGDSGATNPMVQMDMVGYGTNGYLGQMNMYMTPNDTYNSTQIDMFSVYANTGAIFNENGASYADFRVESDSNSHMLFVDAGSNEIGINDSAPPSKVSIVGGGSTTSTLELCGTTNDASKNDNATISAPFSLILNVNNQTAGDQSGRDVIIRDGGQGYTGGTEIARFGLDESTINGASQDMDFRVESNDSSEAIYVDGGLNRVGIFASSGENNFNVNAQGTSHSSGTLPPGMTLYNNGAGNGNGNAITWKDAIGAQGVAGIASFRTGEYGGYGRDLRFYVNDTVATNAFTEGMRLNEEQMLSTRTVGWSVNSLNEPTVVATSEASSSGSIYIDYYLDSATNQWSTAHFFMTISQITGGAASNSAAWYLVRAHHYNGSISFSIRDSGGDTGSFTTAFSDSGGTDPIAARIGFSGLAGTAVLNVMGANYFGVEKVV